MPFYILIACTHSCVPCVFGITIDLLHLAMVEIPVHYVRTLQWMPDVHKFPKNSENLKNLYKAFKTVWRLQINWVMDSNDLATLTHAMHSEHIVMP